MEDWSTEIGRAELPFGLKFFSHFYEIFRTLSRRSDGGLRRGLCDLMDMKVRVSPSDWCREFAINEGVGIIVYKPHQIEKEEEEGSSQGFPVLFYFHGGGFAFMRAASAPIHGFCKKLSDDLRVCVVSVDYRRSPEHKCPIAYDDCIGAIEWLENAVSSNAAASSSFFFHGLDLSRCFLMGDSAGGNIVHHVAMALAQRQKQRQTKEGNDDDGACRGVQVRGNVLLFPFFGGEERTPSEVRLSYSSPFINLSACDWFWKAYLPLDATRDHPACHVFEAMAAQHADLPIAPSFVAIAEFDLLKDWGMRYVETLSRRMGKEVQTRYYRGGVHCFHLIPNLKLSRRLLDDVGKFVERHSKQG